MKICCEGETLNITDVEELSLANSDCFGRETLPALASDVKSIIIDLSVTNRLDCSGVGALAAFCRTARERNRSISVRVVNPPPAACQILRLTRMENLVHYVRS
jgi:anti-anti-sigma factor